MIVYRVCSKREISFIEEISGFDNVGNYYDININKNTFKYIKNIKYLHFYEKYEDILYSDTRKGRVFCKYDIPDFLLLKYKGIGFYLDYINFKNIINVNEYAIPTRELCYNYLVEYDTIEHDLDYEDIFDAYSKRLILTMKGYEKKL